MEKSFFDTHRIIETFEIFENTELYLVEEVDTKREFLLKKTRPDNPDMLFEKIKKEFFRQIKKGFTVNGEGGGPAVLDFFLQNKEFYLLTEYRNREDIGLLNNYPSIGKVLNDHYLVLNGLDLVGAGIFYRVFDLLSETYGTLKEMSESDGMEGFVKTGFNMEAKLLSSLKHPGIPVLKDFFIEEKKLYILMGYMEGKTLRYLIDHPERESLFTEGKALLWTAGVCDILEYLHSHSVVFRAITPERILITPADEVKVINFNKAKILETEDSDETEYVPSLNRDYISPEQAVGRSLPAGDIYSLGVVLYHMLSGKSSCRKFSLEDDKDSLSSDLAGIFSRSFTERVEDRFSSAGEMKEELLRLFEKLQKFEKEEEDDDTICLLAYSVDEKKEPEKTCPLEESDLALLNIENNRETDTATRIIPPEKKRDEEKKEDEDTGCSSETLEKEILPPLPVIEKEKTLEKEILPPPPVIEKEKKEEDEKEEMQSHVLMDSPTVFAKPVHYGELRYKVNEEDVTCLLHKDSMKIGRSGENDLLLSQDLEVSSRHAEIIRHGNSYFIKDLGSTNGTYVNNIKIESVTELKDEDKIKIGKTDFTIFKDFYR